MTTMDNTNENALRFKAQYYGAPVIEIPLVGATRRFTYMPLHGHTLEEMRYRPAPITLRSLERITAEDAIVAAKHIYRGVENALFGSDIANQPTVFFSDGMEVTIFDDGSGFSVDDPNDPCTSFTSFDELAAFDSLRSQGYALPWMGVSVKDQLEFGWIRLIGEV